MRLEPSHGVIRVVETRLVACLVAAALGATGPAMARSIDRGDTDTGLFVFDQTFPNNTIWQVNTRRPSVHDPLVTELHHAVPECELVNGSFFCTTSTSPTMYRVNASTGALTQTITLDFPFGGNVITAMEYANGILYGCFATTGGDPTGPPPRLVRINTTSGLVSNIGVLQNVDAPLAGLAFRDGVMYAVNSRAGAAAHLYTVSLVNGISTDLGVITEEFTGATITLTGLEFGLDGVLYGLGRGTTNNDFLYAINPVSRRATTIGLMPGLFNATSLTSGVIPAPGGLGLAALGLLAAGRRRQLA